MKLGFIKPTYPGEKRVALLPEHITKDFENELIIEDEYGTNMSITNEEYINFYIPIPFIRKNFVRKYKKDIKRF